jgi:hypothetical protein
MSTGKKLVSDVRSIHKLLSTDSLITDRVIYSVIRRNALLLVKRETNLRRLWATDTIFTVIPCLGMEEVPVSECCGYVDPCTVARSKYKLPGVAEGNYQYIIQGVYSINALGGRAKKLKEITINRYINLLKLPFTKKEEYYWIQDGYIYVSNPMVRAIRLVALFEEEVPNELMYPDCECGGLKVEKDKLCVNPLDKEFFLPGYLEKQVVDLASQELLRTYFSLKSDITEEGLDEQAPNINTVNSTK